MAIADTVVLFGVAGVFRSTNEVVRHVAEQGIVSSRDIRLAVLVWCRHTARLGEVGDIRPEDRLQWVIPPAAPISESVEFTVPQIDEVLSRELQDLARFLLDLPPVESRK